MVDLGPPPDDAMEMAKWSYRLLINQAYETMMDPMLSQRLRRQEVRVILAGAARHMTDAARFDVAEVIRKDRAQLDERKRGKAAAKLQKLPPAGGAKVIPIKRADG